MTIKLGEEEPKEKPKLTKWTPETILNSNSIIKSKSLSFETHNNTIYMELHKGYDNRLYVDFGEFNFALEELEQFINFVKEAPSLLETLEVGEYIPGTRGKIDSGIIIAELNRILPKLQDAFNRDDIFFSKLKTK